MNPNVLGFCIGQGMSAFTRVLISYFIGHNKPKKIIELVWKSLKYSTGTSIITGILVFIFRENISSFFFKEKELKDILSKSYIIVAIQIPSEFLSSLLNSLFM